MKRPLSSTLLLVKERVVTASRLSTSNLHISHTCLEPLEPFTSLVEVKEQQQA
ncbi:hypothetical protein ABIA55_003573 [Pseudomonas frederiksbergensis]